MSGRPATSSSVNALRVDTSTVQLPNTVVSPVTSSSGDASARKIAMASSMPGSVSMITGLLATTPIMPGNFPPTARSCGGRGSCDGCATVRITACMALPPGPRMPVLVQTMLFLTVRPHLYRFLRRRHGDVFTTRLLGSGTVVTLSRPEHIRQVFAGTPDVYHAGEGNEILRPVMGPRSVMITDEDEHQRTRKMLMPVVNGAALRGYGDMMSTLAVDNVSRWPVGRPFPVHPAMNDVTLEIILRVVFGMADGPRLTELRRRLRKLIEIGPLTALGWSYGQL